MIEFKPTDKQAKFLASDDDICMMAGGAGSGKSYIMLWDALGINDNKFGPRFQLPYYRALIFRKQFKQLAELIDKSKTIYPIVDPGAVYTSTNNTWTFSSGAQIRLSYFETYSQVESLQGISYAYIGIDEIGTYEDDKIFLYALSRLRSPEGLKPYLRCTSNPSRYKWLMEYFRIGEFGESTNFKLEYTLSDGSKSYKSIRYIQAMLKDNPYLGKDYETQLMMLPTDERKALLDGNWLAYFKIENQVYESELKQLIEENRFCAVRHDPSVSVSTYFDLGINDEMVILFVQHVGKEIRVINMMHGRNKGLEAHWIPEINRLASEQGYQYHKHYLPHDAKQRDKFDATSIEAKIKSKLGNVEVLQRSSLVDGIQSTRSMFPNIWIDKINCQDLLDGLQKYIRETDSAGNVKAVPIHSDIADAFRYISYASPKVGIKDITPGKSASPFTFTR